MGALNSLASLGLNLALNQRAQAAEDKQLKQERDRQLKAIDLRDTEDRRQQELSLRRRLAEERARAGGAGVGSSGGAADAILSGLVEESRLVDAARGREPGLRRGGRFATSSRSRRRRTCSTARRRPSRSDGPVAAGACSIERRGR